MNRKRYIFIAVSISSIIFLFTMLIAWNQFALGKKETFIRNGYLASESIKFKFKNIELITETIRANFYSNYDMDQEGFRRLSNQFRQHMPIISKVSFYRLLTDDDRSELVDEMQSEGYPDFEIISWKNGQKSIVSNNAYYIYKSMEDPFTPTTSMTLGTDILSSSEDVTVVQEAVDKGYNMTLNSEEDTIRVLVTIYEGQSIPDIEQRNYVNVFGIVELSINLSLMMEEVGKDYQLDGMTLAWVEKNTEKYVYQNDRQIKGVLPTKTVVNTFNNLNRDIVVNVVDTNGRGIEMVYSLSISILIGALFGIGIYFYLKDRHDQREHINMIKSMEEEKMSSMSRLVAGVAHEINTPLGVAMTMVSFLTKEKIRFEDKVSNGRLTRDDLTQYIHDTSETLSLINSNLSRSAVMVNNFKKMSTQQAILKESKFVLKNCIDGVILSLKHEYKNRPINIWNHCDPDLVICSYQGLFIQIYTNLIMNSLKHGFVTEQSGEILINTQIDAQYICLLYEDTGNGIAKEHEAHIFEPFYTTGSKSDNSGLGLSIIYNCVVNDLKGQIKYVKRDEGGVVFKIYLPRDILAERL